MRLDWEMRNYDFDARTCGYSWKDIRLVALKSELNTHPRARSGDLMITFQDHGNAEKIVEHFGSYDNFRQVSFSREGEAELVHVYLTPLDRMPARA
jgi:hypothetical protein